MTQSTCSDAETIQSISACNTSSLSTLKYKSESRIGLRPKRIGLKKINADSQKERENQKQIMSKTRKIRKSKPRIRGSYEKISNELRDEFIRKVDEKTLPMRQVRSIYARNFC